MSPLSPQYWVTFLFLTLFLTLTVTVGVDRVHWTRGSYWASAVVSLRCLQDRCEKVGYKSLSHSVGLSSVSIGVAHTSLTVVGRSPAHQGSQHRLPVSSWRSLSLGTNTHTLSPSPPSAHSLSSPSPFVYFGKYRGGVGGSECPQGESRVLRVSVERQVRVASPSQYSVTQPLSDSDGGGDSWSIEFDAVIVLRSAVDSPVCSSTRCEKVSSKSLSQFVGLVSVLAGLVSERLEVVPAQSEARVKSFGDSSQLTFGDSSQLSFGHSSQSTFGDSSQSTFGDSSQLTFGHSSQSTFGDSSQLSFGDSSQLTFGDSSQLSCGDSSLSTFEVGCDAREPEWQSQSGPPSAPSPSFEVVSS